MNNIILFILLALISVNFGFNIKGKVECYFNKKLTNGRIELHDVYLWVYDKIIEEVPIKENGEFEFSVIDYNYLYDEIGDMYLLVHYDCGNGDSIKKHTEKRLTDYRDIKIIVGKPIRKKRYF